MRTLLVLSCLAFVLLVVSGSGLKGRTALNRRSLQKLQQLHGNVQKRTSSANVRRFGRMLNTLKDKKSLTARGMSESGEDDEAYEEGEAFLEEVVMMLVGSPDFCAKPIDESDVQAIRETVDRLGQNMTIELGNLVDLMDQTDLAPDDDTAKAAIDAFIEGIDAAGTSGDEVLIAASSFFYRYVIYGTSEESNCEIGDSYPSWEGETSVENIYNRMECIGTMMFFFAWFVQDPYNTEMWGDEAFTEDSDAAWEAQRCKLVSEYIYGLDDYEDADYSEVMDKLKDDLACVRDKTQDAVDYTPESTDDLASRSERLYETFLQIYSDMSDIGFSLWALRNEYDFGPESESDSQENGVLKRLLNALTS